MLHSRNFPLNLWAEAANTAVFVWNRTVTKQISDITFFQKMFDQVPDVSYFRTFGSDAYLHVPKKQQTKLAAKSQKLVLVGYDQKGRAYRLWNPNTKRICVGVDVIINETLGIANTIPNYIESHVKDGTVFLHPIVVSAAPNTTENIPTSIDRPSVNMPILSDNSNPILHDHMPHDQFPNEDTYYEANSTPVQTLEIQTEPLQREIVSPVQEGNELHQRGETVLPSQNEHFHIQSAATGSNEPPNIQSATTGSNEPPNIQSAATGSTFFANTSTDDNRGGEHTDFDAQNTESLLRSRSKNPPIRYGEWVKYDNNKSKDGSVAYIATQSARILEPITYQEAMNSLHAQQWKEAMATEFASLIANKTWVLKSLPEGRKAVKCKWIYKVKYKPSGEVERFKARLVAKGYSQVAGVDFTETYTPVIKYDVVRAIFVISNAHGMFKAQFDVCKANLNADLIDIIFMEQPEGFEDLTGRFMFVFSSKVYMVSSKVHDAGIRLLTSSPNNFISHRVLLIHVYIIARISHIQTTWKPYLEFLLMTG